MHHQEINLPVNFSSEDREYFKCLQWNYADPKITSRFFSILYPEGYSTNIFFKPLKNIEPWPGFYKSYKRSLFLGEVLSFIKKRKVKVGISPVYYCCINELSDNFFHWFTEVIPKMIFAKNNAESNIIFYIPFPLKEYQLLSLELCGLRVVEEKDVVTLFHKLKVVENIYKYPGYYHPDLMQQTAQLIKNTFLSGNRNRKIYVTRKNAGRRKILNEDEIIKVLLKYGFEILDFDLIGFKQQLEISVNTSVMVSLHGAALTNMLFMEPGATIIEFLPKRILNDKCYFILAGTMQHQYYYLTCDMDGTNHITSNFLVDSCDFENVLTNALA